MTWPDLAHRDIAHRSAKGLERARFRMKAHAHRLLVSNIVGGQLGELHNSPLRSTSATSRSPVKSTLA